MSKITLAIIAKDEVSNVKRIIELYGSYFDAIDIAVDDKLDEFSALANDKVHIHPYTWCDDFSHKRNFLASKVTTTYYFRLDTDDEIENPQIIPDIVSLMDKEGFDIFYVPYLYAKDVQGNLVAKHWRETVIRKRDDIYWKKRVHENIFLPDPSKVKTVRDDRLKLIHNITHEHALESYQRNIKLLIEEFKEDGPNCDPRTIAYIGRMLMAKGKWSEAIIFLENLVKRSGWEDDKYFAWVQMSQCYVELGKHDLAIACCNEALALNTQFPDAYLQMGAVYLTKADYTKACDWIMPGIARPEPDTVYVVDPSFYGYKARINAALALLGKGDVTQAYHFFQEAKKTCNGDSYVLGHEKLFLDSFERDQYVKALAFLCNYTQRLDRSKVHYILDSMPQEVFIDERSSAIRNNYSSPQVWESDTITFFCGLAWEDWAPPSTVRGIGGSEEAVIYLSRELTKLGYKVTVYNMCGDLAGEYEGVTYRNFHEFNPRDTFNILISWRNDMVNSTKARFKAVWLHDVPQPGQFTEESVKSLDKILVLSNFHKTLLPSFIPAEKVFVTSNGINLPDFKSNGVLRNPRRMIYTSSYDRGIQHLLLLWPEIREAVPDAELHLFYGWNTYDEMMKQGLRPQGFRQAMTQLMQQPGVFEHGRVGHRQLVREFQQSGIWVYPSHFEEISCISAMKAQAAGCVPVCTDYAALSETVKAGIKVKGRCDDESVKKEFKEKLIEVLKSEELQVGLRAELEQTKDTFSWERVARQWREQLFPAEVSA